ncbi:MAG: winged helix-turn-helix transcriptional regulator [Candidatus Abyssobacteria bacterium SURF_5]|uniref:Winged helix-turn-helix transcriptional regulator n=1 Tax=Abyssobacteria bacterium (strain SURF_5) TaxID=2093360 RepID=A0A3A4NQ04_ABYX5|nr:MAG: winged helix-turn-helix transcriptional regulator [Candidatus Abyssubacteria bacterium SURF_5]
MDQKSIKELELLHELSKSEHINQRHLSNKLGMAAGLVNLYMRRLARKGYIKIGGIKPRRLKYLITPRGVAEKTRLTYEFALISYKYFKSATDDIKNKLKHLEQSGERNVVVYGTGELAELCLLLMEEFDINIVAVVDDDFEAPRFQEHPVVPRIVLRNLRFDKVLVAQLDGHEEIAALLAEVGVGAEKLCWLLDA